MTSIGDYAFNSSWNLTSVTICAQIPPTINKPPFSGYPSIYVPCGALEAYENAAVWKDLDLTFFSPDRALTLASNHPGWGTPKVIYADCGVAVATVEAMPASEEYAFVKWNDGNIENPRTLQFDKDTALTAVFTPLVDLPKQKIGDLWYRLIPESHTAFVIRNSADPYNQTEISIPSSVVRNGEEYAVTMLNDSAFYNCKELKSISIPGSVTKVASCVFQGCASLESVSFAENVASIGFFAFEGCEALESITIPKGIKSLGWGAFWYCQNLASITIESPLPPVLSEFVFEGVAAQTINVPCGAEEAYKSAANWASVEKKLVSPTIDTVINATIVEGETYVKNDFAESEAGHYTLSLESVNGCDSIVTLVLTVVEETVDGFKGTVADEGNTSTTFSTIDDLKKVLTGNTIVSFSEAVPAEWAELPNVVVNGTANSIVLSNNGGAYSYSGEINAESVEFHLYPTVSASSGGGWMSVAIPFAGVSDVAPRLKGDGKAGGYWAKKFVGSTDSALVFETVGEPLFEANVPYIFAFSGEGATTDHLTISATNTTVQSSEAVLSEGGSYDMVSIYNGKSEANAYLLNEDGTRFVLSDEPGEVIPFSAYALRNDAMSAAPVLRALGGQRVRSLAILDADEIGFTIATELPAVAVLAAYAEEGDIVIRAGGAGKTAVYSLSGRVMKASALYGEGEMRISGLGSGAYIVAGLKVVLK